MILGALLAAQGSHDRIVGSDGFFHVAAAASLGSMPWMPLTVFGDGWVDHQLLFHALLAPLAWTLPPVLAAKAGAALLGALGLGALHLVLRRRDAPAPLLFALLPIAISWQFLVRLEMPRAQGLSLALMLACCLALLEGRHRLLFVLAWLYAWTYQVALLVLPIAVLHSGLLFLRRPGAPEPTWRAPVAALLGLAAGFVIHPHSPGTLRFLWQHVVLKVLNRDDLPVGTEWQPASPSDLFTIGGGTLLVLGVAAVLARRRLSHDVLFALLLAAGATVGALVAGKFLEYATPLSCLALGLALRDRPVRLQPLAAGTALLALGSTAWATSAIERSEPPPDRLAPALDHLRAHAAPGERIYHFSWNDFPELVLHGPEYQYIVGLDPHFLQLAHPDLWTLYDRIGRGWGTNPSKPIAERFGATWAILVLPYPGEPEALLDADPGLRRAWSDEHAVVYEVVHPAE